MRIEPLGDAAFLLRGLDRPAHSIARALNDDLPEDVVEAVASYDTVGLHVRPGAWNAESLLRDVTTRLVREIVPPESRLHRIPVCYAMGEDLAAASETLGLTPDQLAHLHASASYRCVALGFCPGFPYLSGLPRSLQGVPRRASPRPRVPAGSVAIARDQAGIYPLERPGGWALIGRTPLTIVDVESDYFPIAAGDGVQFVPIDEEEFARLAGERL
jgi:inhibitor of KinA